MHFLNDIYFLLLIVPLLLAIFSFKRGSNIESYFSNEMFKKLYQSNGGFSSKTRKILLLLSSLFLIVALARPVLDKGQVKVDKKVYEMAVAFDISKSMFVDDIYPNRLEFAKRKFDLLLDNLKEAQVGVIAFSSRAFLISPPTDDYASLKYLVSHMSYNYISLKGTNLMAPLISANDLLSKQKQKILVIFSDGGDSKKLTKEIEYARKHHIVVFIYATATKKGGVIKTKNGVQKDSNGNIVISRLNSAIKRLAIESGGGYMEYSLNRDDMRYFAQKIMQKAKAKESKQSIIKDYKELFYYPLIASIILLFMALFSLPQRRDRRWKKY